jgi:hypothetical protein
MLDPILKDPIIKRLICPIKISPKSIQLILVKNTFIPTTTLIIINPLALLITQFILPYIPIPIIPLKLSLSIHHIILELPYIFAASMIN